jgi:hypothetical protein
VLQFLCRIVIALSETDGLVSPAKEPAAHIKAAVIAKVDQTNLERKLDFAGPGTIADRGKVGFLRSSAWPISCILALFDLNVT